MAGTGKTPDLSEAFIREVDEDLQRDQWAALWSRYGRWFLMAIGLGLVTLAAYLYWDQVRAEQRQMASEQLAQALGQVENGAASPAQGTLQALAAGDEPGVASLARLTLAGILAQQGKRDQAAAAYADLAGDTRVATPFRDVALLKSVQARFDDMDPKDVIAALQPLAQEGAPWFGPAGELVAMAHLKNNKPDLALPIFQAMAANRDLSPSLRVRAGQMVSMLAPAQGQGSADTAVPGMDAEAADLTGGIAPDAAVLQPPIVSMGE